MTGTDGVGVLLPALVAWPFLAALLVLPMARLGAGARDAFVVGATAFALLGAGGLALLAADPGWLRFRVPALLGHLEFAADPFAVCFVLLTAFVWLAATLYSVPYLKHEGGASGRFHTASLIGLGAALGVVLSGSLLTLFVFFEILGLVAFVLVIHTGTGEARRAAVKYFWMMLPGGFLLLAGILLTYALGGEGMLAPLPPEVGPIGLRWVAAGLLILGFGVKAGMIPVHVWLPDAHSAAPSPASALLSGVMIKAGAYGIFRTLTALLRPGPEAAVQGELWAFSAGLGLVVLWLGLATMAVGVVLALGQTNAKRLLAYSSVSQMGFILTGFGAAAYLATDGAVGLAGGILHATNHALLKAALFLGIGAVVLRTGELGLTRPGGLWRRMPVTFLFTLLAAAGITGVPLLNGFVSKSLIHHALAASLHEAGPGSLAAAEFVFMATSAGTVAVLLKLMIGVFFGSSGREYGPNVAEAPRSMLVAMGLLGVAIVLTGLRPHLLLEGLVSPGIHLWALPSTGLDRMVEHGFLTGPDLRSAAVVLLFGALAFLAAARWRLFDLEGPSWLGVDFWYRRGATGLVRMGGWLGRTYEAIRTSPGRLLAGRGGGRRGPLSLEGLPLPSSTWRRVSDDPGLEVARMRRRIRRYASEMSLNIAVIFLVLLVFLATLFQLPRGR